MAMLVDKLQLLLSRPLLIRIATLLVRSEVAAPNEVVTRTLIFVKHRERDGRNPSGLQLKLQFFAGPEAPDG